MHGLTQPNLRPGPGHLLRDYQLSDTAGKQMMLSDYRGKSNLVLITSQAENTAELARLLHELDSQSARLREYEAQVIVILSCAERFDIPAVRVLLDDRSNALRELGAPAVYITDKFREVVHRFDSLSSADDILGWVEFTVMQCPECHPPEWPPVE
jgi:hypothetical protein